MPAPVAGIHVFTKSSETQGVDGRDKPGHDGFGIPGHDGLCIGMNLRPVFAQHRAETRDGDVALGLVDTDHHVEVILIKVLVEHLGIAM